MAAALRARRGRASHVPPPAVKTLRLLFIIGVIAGFIAMLGPPVFTLANLASLPGNYERRSDVPFGSHGLSLDTYRPPEAHNRPIIVYWFGGAWRFGSKEQYRYIGAALAEAGYIAVLPDYRLYPEAKFPDFVQDGAQALAWAVHHARDIGGDPNRVYVAGHSSGAHLAAMLAYDEQWARAAGVPAGTIRGFIGLAGPYALKPDADDPRIIFTEPFTLADWQPIQLARAGAPPALLIHGDADQSTYVGHSRGMAEKLQAVGVPVRLLIYPARNHRDPILAFARWAPDQMPVLEEIGKFVGPH